MKTGRRHELQTNELADALSHWIVAIQPYGRAIVAALVASVVLVFAWWQLSAAKERRTAAGWEEYFSALDDRGTSSPRVALTEVADRYRGTHVGQWARVVAADLRLDEGTNRLLSDPKNAKPDLREAADEYRSLIEESQDSALLQRAKYGVARAHEAMGKLEDARRDYRELADRWPDSPYAAPSKQRANDLDRTETKLFYDWLAKYEPPRPATQPEARPDFSKDFLDLGLPKSSTTDNTVPTTRFPVDLNAPVSADGAQPSQPAEKPADDDESPILFPPNPVAPPSDAPKPVDD